MLLFLNLLPYIVVFIFGITIGSFLNVCIYRIPLHESIVTAPSHCMTCGKKLKWYDMVPVFSWLVLGGKCRNCGSSISAQYPMIEAVKMSGSSVPKILFKHILPNIAGQILVTAVLDIGTMMMELAGLSFLGLGVQPPAAEWGSMINDGRSMLQISPWMVLAPGVAIFITVMIFNLLGDTLRDYMDPKQRAKNKREEKNK